MDPLVNLAKMARLVTDLVHRVPLARMLKSMSDFCPCRRSARAKQRTEPPVLLVPPAPMDLPATLDRRVATDRLDPLALLVLLVPPALLDALATRVPMESPELCLRHHQLPLDLLANPAALVPLDQLETLVERARTATMVLRVSPASLVRKARPEAMASLERLALLESLVPLAAATTARPPVLLQDTERTVVIIIILLLLPFPLHNSLC